MKIDLLVQMQALSKPQNQTHVVALAVNFLVVSSVFAVNVFAYGEIVPSECFRIWGNCPIG